MLCMYPPRPRHSPEPAPQGLEEVGLFEEVSDPFEVVESPEAFGEGDSGYHF